MSDNNKETVIDLDEEVKAKHLQKSLNSRSLWLRLFCPYLNDTDEVRLEIKEKIQEDMNGEYRKLAKFFTYLFIWLAAKNVYIFIYFIYVLFQVIMYRLGISENRDNYFILERLVQLAALNLLVKLPILFLLTYQKKHRLFIPLYKYNGFTLYSLLLIDTWILVFFEIIKYSTIQGTFLQLQPAIISLFNFSVLSLAFFVIFQQYFNDYKKAAHLLPFIFILSFLIKVC